MTSFLLLQTAAAGAASQARDQEKTDFLYNFSKFVEWPPSAYDSRGIHFHICILGEDSLGDAFNNMLNKTIQGRIPKIRRVRGLWGIEKCNLLFIGASESGRLAEILAALRGSNVLTVSDIPGFARRGGMVAMIMEEEKIGFEINLDSLTGAGLKIKSQLLRLAGRVYTRGP
jgi:hypothetical protein